MEPYAQERDDLVWEKVNQALGLLARHDVDLWLIFGQETGFEQDPVYPLLMGERDMGGGFLLLTRTGRKIAVTGGLDRMIPLSTGVWDEGMVFTGSPYQTLLDLLTDLNPRTIAVNYSRDIPVADGLSHGRYLRLMDALHDTPFAGRIVSAGPMAAALRSVKSPGEIRRIEAAIESTDTVFRELERWLRPGMTGAGIFAFIQNRIRALGLTPAWSRYNCPVLTMGPVPFMGHTPPPPEARFAPGQLMQVDLGIRRDGYCSDFQRMFYALGEGESAPPDQVVALFRTVRKGIDVMVSAVGPGVSNDVPSSLGFKVITGAGFPEPLYSAGHQLGRAVHDGGTGLVHFSRPHPGAVMELGNVFTVEGLETRLEGYGWISLEEDVVVTEEGCRLLTRRQNELILIAQEEGI